MFPGWIDRGHKHPFRYKAFLFASAMKLNSYSFTANLFISMSRKAVE